MARDSHMPVVALLSGREASRERWRRELAGLAMILVDQAAQDVDPLTIDARVEVIVTDDPAAALAFIKDPRCIVLVDRDESCAAADVILPPNYPPREIQIAVPLLASLSVFRQSCALLTESVQQTARQATTDFLTGLSNRWAWESHRQLFSKRYFPACVALLDLDNFKACINAADWSFGDAVLKAVAEALSQAGLNRRDLVARWGGDEFALFFVKADRPAIAAHLDKLRDEVAALRFAEAPGIALSASVGCAMLPSADQFDAAFAACQQALREAKNRGGNCSVFAEIPDSN